MSGKDAALQSRLRLIGTGILVAGMLAATLVDLTAKPDDGSATADYKRDEYQMEYIGGKSNLLATEIREWIGSLWHGRRLSETLAVLSIGGSAACFFLAQRLNFSPAAGNREDGTDA
jgi:hypothetical protein